MRLNILQVCVYGHVTLKIKLYLLWWENELKVKKQTSKVLVD